MRRCSRTACPERAVATLTYVYAESTAVLGPLATFAEPHTYDLCGEHAQRLTAPRGWDVVRLSERFEDVPEAPDDLLAVADALRERSAAPGAAEAESGAPRGGTSARQESADYPGRHRPKGASDAPMAPGREQPLPGLDAVAGDRRGHLRVLRDVEARSADR